MKPQITSYDRDADHVAIATTLREEGTVIVRNVLSHEVMDQLRAAVAPHLRQPGGNQDFYGPTIETCPNLFSRGEIFLEQLALNPIVLNVLDHTLLPKVPSGPAAGPQEPKHPLEDIFPLQPRDPKFGPNCHHYRASLGSAIQVKKGSKPQVLHREMDIYHPYIVQAPDSPDWSVAVNFAGTDFTAENGATHIVPGSHRWEWDRDPLPEETTQGVMPKGSALFWLGKTFHGLGRNTTDIPRTGFLSLFQVNWLSQEENQFVAVPRELVTTYSEQAQRILGYRGGNVGWATGYELENLLRAGDSGIL
jgi:hypothetical protein